MLEAQQLSKIYKTSAGALSILNDVSLTLAAGDSACVTGPSGSGKSTLLYILGGLEPPSSGTVQLDGVDPYGLAPNALAAFRNRGVGFVLQDHCLLPQCTVLENVLIPTLVARAGDMESRARTLIDQVGLTPRLTHRPGELSGGEKQRVAIARALIMSPLLLLCDEPTGNLDRASADNVASLIVDLHQRERTILVVVTHSAELASRFPVTLELIDRRLRPMPVSRLT
jgi:lipoprotein-releasing system ATP-binding protein